MSPDASAPRRVCVFAGSALGTDPAFATAARELGAELGAHDYDLVFGGETAGLMGAVADGAIEEGARAIGVIPRFLADLGTPHPGAEIRLCDTLAERKALMSELSRGFVALPGGLGTLDELTEMVTWTQLGVHAGKPLALLEVAGCWAKLAELLDSMVADGFLRAENRALLRFVDSPAAALAAVEG